jgi:hypothetical protein
MAKQRPCEHVHLNHALDSTDHCFLSKCFVKLTRVKYGDADCHCRGRRRLSCQIKRYCHRLLAESKTGTSVPEQSHQSQARRPNHGGRRHHHDGDCGFPARCPASQLQVRIEMPRRTWGHQYICGFLHVTGKAIKFHPWEPATTRLAHIFLLSMPQ